ncbi:MAG: NAD-glutamate dehydrogenase [SAR324 cluster bacterium]|nr:NAD-glutamate dehydrogenase [SAR324 cluster bacterium]
MTELQGLSDQSLLPLRRLAEKEKGPQAALFRKYAQLFLRQSAASYFAGHPPEIVLEFLRDRFSYLKHRTPGTASIRIARLKSGMMGSAEPSTLIEILTGDGPFLMDSVQGVLAAWNLPLHAIFHPILRVRRDGRGRLTSVQEFDGAGMPEVQILLVTDAIPAGVQRKLQSELQTTLDDVISCVGDFPAISAQLDVLHVELSGGPHSASSAQLLRWFQEDNFIFLGMLPFKAGGRAGTRSRPLRPLGEQGLGLLRSGRGVPAHRRRLQAQAVSLMAGHAGKYPFFVVEESDERSNVHQRDIVTLLLLAARNPAQGGHAWAVAGVFTRHSQRGDVREIPVLKQKTSAALRRLELVPRSHKYKELLDFLNGMPKLDLFRLSARELGRILSFVFSVTDHPRSAVQFAVRPDKHSCRVLVAFPGGFFPPEKMEAIRKLLEVRLGCEARHSFVIRLGMFSLFGLLFHPPGPLRIGGAYRRRLIAEIHNLLRTRELRLLETWLASGHCEVDEATARALVAALSEEYLVAHEDGEILADLNCLARLQRDGVRQLDLRPGNGGGMKIVLYDREFSSLSRIMPIFTNLRLHVIEERAFQLELSGREAHIQYFRVQSPGEQTISPARDMERLRGLLFPVLSQELENDPLNALLCSCGFDWRQISLMMMLRNYLMQVGTVYTKRTINETLVRRPAATRALYGIFDARFNPAYPMTRVGKLRASRTAELYDAMEDIDNLTEDRIYKRFLNLIQAAVRTNYFQNADNPVLALKFDSRTIDELPHPRPLYEIWVFGPLMEAVHLRGGMIARGGIRYSDRPDDFRTEVLGLMDTQMKKNALIVPVGSKGGFVVKNLAPYGGDARKAGDAQYAVFMQALLSVTDNLVGGRITPPPNTLRHDGDDPYLVVAADKGTAHLSDTANAISSRHGFWLGDAFASGGSNGYDHKAIAITAQGGWESVKRHFWEMGSDLAKESVRVVGIGDMSGDVFGNGMLLNSRMKLVGAFNHLHVFLDPDPHPEDSFKERKRLFRLPRSGWNDYNPALISRGGGVYPRNAKAILLNPEARQLLQVHRPEISGEETVRALLGLNVDLIWNGGIGTYIKSADESDAEVGDHGNDAVRINAQDCHARVLGEGGNLGLTQAARVAIDEAGGRINTDAIDNAGGVHMSDQEVNLKILLGRLLAAGRLKSMEQRNRLLRQLTGAVTGTVIHRNYLQTITLSMDRLRSAADVQPYLRLVGVLAGEGRLDRRAERIPNADAMQVFQARGSGLPRPVLAVLLSGVKMVIVDRLQASSLLDDPYLKKFYFEYFPAALVRSHSIDSVVHPLERQIKGTVVTNLVVDQAGMAFVPETASYTGRDWPEVVRAYLLADEVSQARAMRQHIYTLDYKMPAAVQYELLMVLEDFLADFVRDVLMHEGGKKLKFDKIQQLRKGMETFQKMRVRGAGAVQRKEVQERARAWCGYGMQRGMAERAAWLPRLKGSLALSRLADAARSPIPLTVQLSQELDSRFRLAEVEAAVNAVPGADPWRKQFGDGLLRTIAQRRHAILAKILRARAGRRDPQAWLAAYLEKHSGPWREYEATLNRAFAQNQPDLVVLAVVVEMLDNF